MPDAQMDLPPHSMTTEHVQSMVSRFYSRVSPSYQHVISKRDLELFTYAYLLEGQNEKFLANYLLSEFSGLIMTRQNLKTSNNFAFVLLTYMNFLSGDNKPNVQLIRYDEPMQNALKYLDPPAIILSKIDLMLKNLLHYGLMLMDLGIVTRDGYLSDAPMKSLIHGLALTGMFAVFVYECRNNYWPSVDDLAEKFKLQQGESLGVVQYRQLLSHLLDEVGGNSPARFLRAHQSQLLQIDRLKFVETCTRSIPWFYLGGLILAPATIPLVLVTPFINLGDQPREPQPYDNALCLCLAIYLVTFVYLSISEDVSEFLEQFIYCEKDACFVEEAQYTAAALGGGASSILTILLCALYEFIHDYYIEADFQEALRRPLHHAYRMFHPGQDEQTRLLQIQDIEMGEVSGQGQSINH